MSDDLRTTVLRGLTKALELLPAGSPFALNTQAAIAQIDDIVEQGSDAIASMRAKDGVLAILDKALRQSGYDVLVFMDPELHDIRRIIDVSSVNDWYSAFNEPLSSERLDV